MPFVYGLLLIIGLVVIYSFSLAENSSTKMPEGCNELLTSCSACNVASCGHQYTSRKEEN